MRNTLLRDKCGRESININILIHNYIIYFKTQTILQFNLKKPNQNNETMNDHTDWEKTF